MNLPILSLTTFGLGRLRPAPGTWGSLPPPAIALGLVLLGHGPASSPWVYNGVLAVVLILFSVACVWFGATGELVFGKKDPSQVVADETAGQCLPLLFLPLAADASLERTLAALALAFVAFRVFDIIKLPPANQLQRLRHGWGILADDLVAGVQAAVVVQLAIRVL